MMKRYEIILELLLECFILMIQILLCIYIIPKTIGFLWPFLIGWIIALIALPITQYFQQKFKISKHFLSVFILVLLIGTIGAALFFLIASLGKEALAFMSDAPKMYDQFMEGINHIPNFLTSIQLIPESFQLNMDQIMESLKDVMWSAANKVGNASVEHMGAIASNVTNFFIGIIVSVLSAYFFIVYKDRMYQSYRRLVSKEMQKRVDDISLHIKNALGGYVIAQFKIMAIIFVILSVGLLIGGNPYALFVALLISIVDVIPFLGTGFVLIPWALYDLLAGNYSLMLLRIVLYVICLLSRQLLQPKIIGDSVGLNPFVTLLLIYVGFKAGGIIGFLFAMILGIIVLNFYKLGLFDKKIQRFKHLILKLDKANESI